MGIFFLIAFAITLVCILLVIAPLLKKNKDGKVNITVKSRFLTSIVVTFFLAIGGWLVYFSAGDVTIIEKIAKLEEAKDNNAPEITELMAKLDGHLSENKDDLEGWLIKSRVEMSQGNFQSALRANETAYLLSKSDKYKDTLTDTEKSEIIGRYVDTSVVVDEGQFSDTTHNLLKEAVKLDGDNPQALWLIGMSYSQQGDHQSSLASFNMTREILNATGTAQPEVAQLDKLIAEENLQLGKTETAIKLPQVAADIAEGDVEINQQIIAQILNNQALNEMAKDESGVQGKELSNNNEPNQSSSASLTASNSESESEAEPAAEKELAPVPKDVSEVPVVVTLSPELMAKASPDDTIFIIARATSGPKAPLVVIKETVADLPVEDVINNSKRMLPFTTVAKMVNKKQMIIIARLSKSGQAIKQDDDIQQSVVVHEWLEQGNGFPITIKISE